ncbi:hypothetical protein [Streptococcus ruminantium]|uniref:Uncharacterized protein n=1 Tax=Streptococcus ruminantium TaxID=1917441 RepID=A0ABU1B369_9STRE|nr:hypothetical protein [Streptococcus ruminantium]MDQ8759097.1 hypothetical protein [Streptococcus ruminantium]MDQ8769653.1 hypothetical protein [Streptococcus ruminantium]MDQ8775525.1 hypothetical protein [Streptococcus ruminantium]MDQ8794458.1 hypothetical protein [Streptococcus ruminantium]MDQ8796693.1 hypothetical protein [Streptococcus ruminantium]
MFNGLSEFMNGDGLVALSAIAVILLIRSWRKSDWVELGTILVFYGIIVSVIKGQAILSFIGAVLRWFGIETGL